MAIAVSTIVARHKERFVERCFVWPPRKHWTSGALGDHGFCGSVRNANVGAAANGADQAVRLSSTTTPHQEGPVMQAITVSDRDAGVAGLSLRELPYPVVSENDVVVQAHAAGFTPGELDWPDTWTDRAGRDRTPSVPGHELSGVVVELGYGTTGLSVGQRVFGLADWARNGSLAEYTAVETRNLAPLPIDIDHTVAAALPISGLSAWQGLFDHGRLAAGQTVLIHGAAGGVGSIAENLAHAVAARIIGPGRTAVREQAVKLGVHTFLDLETEKLEDA